MSYSTGDQLNDDDIRGLIGGRADRAPGNRTSVSNILTSIDRFRKIEEKVDMSSPVFTRLSEVEIDSISSNRVLFGRIGDSGVESSLLRNKSYNSFFILNNSITQDLSTLRKPSDERTTQSVDDNIFDLSAISNINPFKNSTTEQIMEEVTNKINSLSRDISLDDNTSDYIQMFKKDVNVSPEDYKKLKIRKASSTDLRGLNRKRSTGV